MSVTISINKTILEDHPELIYQLFYLSSQEKQEDSFYVYTAQGYYKELTDLLDSYYLPYKVYSSQDLSLLHVLVIEEDETLAWDLKEQLEKWGFGSVEITHHYYFSFKSNHKKIVSLAIFDKQIISALSLLEQLGLAIQLFPAPIIFLVTYVQKWKPNIFLALNKSLTLYTPFNITDLRQAVERLLNIALLPVKE